MDVAFLSKSMATSPVAAPLNLHRIATRSTLCVKQASDGAEAAAESATFLSVCGWILHSAEKRLVHSRNRL